MNKRICRKPGCFVHAVRVAAVILVTVSYLVFNGLPAQAHPSRVNAETFPLHTRKARVKAETPHEQELDGMVADNRTRALVRHIHTDQVASLRFSDLLRGPVVLAMPITDDPNQVQVHPYFAPTVTDRRLIAHFLHALRCAYKTKGVTVSLATPLLRITFKKSGRFQRDPLDISINWDCFGLEFQSVLNQVPGYLATQLHRKMSALDGQVREVDFATLKVTDPQKIAQIMRALEQVKPGALGVYGSTYNANLTQRLKK